MCGIAAFFTYARSAPPVAEAELLAAREAMAARGPDGAGLWRAPDRDGGGGRVGLAHRRLAIIDLSDRALQPMTRGSARIVFNGEIYNYKALRAELEARGERFATDSDTEVILALYAREGDGCVARLAGMFAFALWDEGRRRLLLARDPFGIKPLYYSESGGTLRAASTVQALRAGGGCDTAPDPAGHAGFFLLGSIPEPHTLYKSIRALPAGHTLAATEAGVENPKRYFSIAEILRTLRPGEGAAPLAEALRESVARHMVADVPVGVFLSAGIDSTVLCALAAECHGAGLEAVTLGVRAFQGTAQDEVPFAAEVARATGARHRVVWVGAEDFRAAREAALAAMDQPSVDGVNVYFVARAARAAGLKVALSGLGGDELFGGYDTFVKAPQLAAAVGALPISPALGRALRVAAAPLLKPFVHPKWAGVLEWGGDVAGAWYLRRGLYMPWELPEVIDAEMAREGLQALDLAQRLAADGDGLSPWRQVQALEMGWYMRNQLLRDADWAGMAHGLEIRVPLVDATLFARLAPWLGPKGPTKADLARMADQLPPALAARPKTGFSLPIREWLAGPQVSLRDWARLVYRASVSRK